MYMCIGDGGRFLTEKNRILIERGDSIKRYKKFCQIKAILRYP